MNILQSLTEVFMLRIKVLRLANDKTQWELSHEAHISSGRFSMLERGLIDPTVEERERLAHFLGASAASLFRTVGVSRQEKSRAVQ